MGRDEMIRELVGEPGELPAELRGAARAAFATVTDTELPGRRARASEGRGPAKRLHRRELPAPEACRRHEDPSMK